MERLKTVQFNTQVWQEGSLYVAYVPQLDLSSCGKNVEEAKKNIREATEAFLEEAEKIGILKQVLEEAGFVFEKEWRAPDIILFEKMKLAF